MPDDFLGLAVKYFENAEIRMLQCLFWIFLPHWVKNI